MGDFRRRDRVADPAACAGPLFGEGLLGGLDIRVRNGTETNRSLTAIRLIGGGHYVCAPEGDTPYCAPEGDTT